MKKSKPPAYKIREILKNSSEPMTARQIAEKLGVTDERDIILVRFTVGDNTHAGWISVVGRVRCPVTGRYVYTYRFKQDPPRKIDPTGQRQKKARRAWAVWREGKKPTALVRQFFKGNGGKWESAHSVAAALGIPRECVEFYMHSILHDLGDQGFLERCAKTGSWRLRPPGAPQTMPTRPATVEEYLQAGGTIEVLPSFYDKYKERYLRK